MEKVEGGGRGTCSKVLGRIDASVYNQLTLNSDSGGTN